MERIYQTNPLIEWLMSKVDPPAYKRFMRAYRQREWHANRLYLEPFSETVWKASYQDGSRNGFGETPTAAVEALLAPVDF